MARLCLSKKHVDKIFPKFAQARRGWAQPFCRAFELHCHFVVKENPFCRMGGLVLLQNEWLRPHRGNWKGDHSTIINLEIFSLSRMFAFFGNTVHCWVYKKRDENGTVPL